MAYLGKGSLFTIRHYFRLVHQLNAFADNKTYATEKLKLGLGRVENIMKIGEKDCYQHFLLFPECFQKFSGCGSVKLGTRWKRVNCLLHNPDF